MFKSFFKKIDSTVRERLGKNDSPRDGSQVKKSTSKKDTSAIKVPSLVKANDTLKNMSTTLKSSFSRRKASKDEIGREFVEARMVQFEKACVNNRNISSISENLAKVSTAQCSRLKRKSQSWEKFESVVAEKSKELKIPIKRVLFCYSSMGLVFNYAEDNNDNNDIIMPDITEDDVKAELEELFLKLRKERLNKKFKPKKPVQEAVLPTDESRRLQGPMQVVQQVSKLDTVKFIKKITEFLPVDNHI